MQLKLSPTRVTPTVPPAGRAHVRAAKNVPQEARPFGYGGRVHRARGLFARFVAVFAALVALVALPRAALAAGDGAAAEQLDKAMSEDYPGNLGGARRRLNEALTTCAKKGCQGSTKGRIYVALGMVASQLGKDDEARQDFQNAFAADPRAQLPSSGATPNIKTLFAEAASKSSAPADEPADSGGDEPAPAASSADWFRLAREAFEADQAGRLDECIEKDKASLKLQDEPRTRLHLASCESRSGKLVDALKDAQKALESGIQRKDTGVMKIARQRVKELLDRIPHVTFVPPAGVPDLTVKFDDRTVPQEALTKKFSIDPGEHSVQAEGTVNGFPATFEEKYTVKERELLTVRITLKPPDSTVVSPGQIKCMLAAKTQEEVQKCLPQNAKNIVIRLGMDGSGYTDTNSVSVFSPGFTASVASPTAGWNVGGNFLVDAVSAASPDIVATASPPFREYRYAGGLTAGYKPGLYGAQATANYSNEPDYLSFTGGGALTADLNDKLITPRIGYAYSYDKIGRGLLVRSRGGDVEANWLNDFDPLKGFLKTHNVEAGVTIVMSPTTVLAVGLTLQFERGDQSKPYRYVPMFDPIDVAPFVPVGADIGLVNRARLAIRPVEQLPTERDRYAVGARLNKRLGSATLRLEERIYYDSWGTKASTTDARYMVDLSKSIRVWPHARLHVQTAASKFYKLAYSAITCPNRDALECDGQANGTVVVPTYRTGDRELAPLFTLTAGGGARLALGNQEGEVRYGITVVGDVMYSRFLNSLFVRQRTALYGSVGFDVEF